MKRLKYMHFLALGNHGNGMGWYAPKELDAGEGVGNSSLAIPLRSNGTFFSSYWTWLVTLDNSGPKLPDKPVEVLPDDTGLKMKLSTWIRFTVSKMMPMKYQGKLKHPDFRYPFVAISLVEDQIENLLFSQDKMVIIGLDSNEYR